MHGDFFYWYEHILGAGQNNICDSLHASFSYILDRFFLCLEHCLFEMASRFLSTIFFVNNLLWLLLSPKERILWVRTRYNKARFKYVEKAGNFPRGGI